MLTIINTHVGKGKTGNRLWMEGAKLDHAVKPGQVLVPELKETEEGVKLILVVSDDVTEGVTVSKRTNNDVVKPLIEIRDAVLGEHFTLGMKVRVVVAAGKITVEIHAHELSKRERTERMERKLKTGEALRIGSLFLGGGVMDRAIHEGLSAAGIPAYSRFVVERESKYLDAAVANQPELFKDDSILIHSDVENVCLEKPVPVEILVAGIPCTGASRAGRSKNKLAKAEDHESAGACFVSVLSFVVACAPHTVILECVPEYIESASYSVVSAMLSHWGYSLTTEVLDGNVFGALEGRKRMCLVAVTDGDKAYDFSFDLLQCHFEKEATVADILDDISPDDSRWKSYDYLLEKEQRDKASGKGFSRDLYIGTETRVSTIRRLYAKGGSCDQFLCHPDDPTKFRLFTAQEHCRIKKVPDYIIANVSSTTAHEILGQSVVFTAFYAVGYAIGQYAKDYFAIPAVEMKKVA